MSKTVNKVGVFSDTFIGWVIAAIGLAAAFMLDTKENPHKWHAAIMWTGCAFGAVVILRRAKWGSWRFWLSWIICLTVHIFLMWVIFGIVLSRLRFVGTLYMVPLALIESLLLLGIISKLERKLFQ